VLAYSIKIIIIIPRVEFYYSWHAFVQSLKKSQSARYLRALVVEFGRVLLARAAAVVS